MLTYDLEQRAQMPVYEYLYECIRRDILEGRLCPGEKLPSKRSLSRHLGISVVTVEGAYDQLLMEGYIRSEPKVGFFVESLDIPDNVSCLLNPSAEEEFEYSYFADLKSNRLQRSKFPFSVWSRLLRETLSEQDEQLLKTIPYNGIYELRLALSHYLHENRGMDVHPQQIIIGAGTEYLYGRLIQLFSESNIWGLENAGSQKIAAIYDMYRAKRQWIQTDEEGPVIKSLTKAKANVIHVSPANHFPFGKVMPVKRRQELIRWAFEKPERYILEDDYDSEYKYKGRAMESIYAMDHGGRTIYMNTFSKTLIPSLRISFMVLPTELMERYKSRLSFYSGTVSGVEQYTLAKFIAKGYYERHINRMKNYFRTIRNELLQAIQDSPLGSISTVTDPGCGTYFLLHLDTHLSDPAITKEAAAKGINVSALSEYLQDCEKDTHTLVINYCGIHRERISQTVKLLASLKQLFV